MEQNSVLINAAVGAIKSAYCPYSHFAVGAALLAADGRIFTGCNIENSSYPAGICAERAAFCAAISAGVRDFSAIAVAGGKHGIIDSFCQPCGICRQVMSEFCGPDFLILTFDGKKIAEKSLGELLPEAFGGDIL